MKDTAGKKVLAKSKKKAEYLRGHVEHLWEIFYNKKKCFFKMNCIICLLGCLKNFMSKP